MSRCRIASFLAVAALAAVPLVCLGEGANSDSLPPDVLLGRFAEQVKIAVSVSAVAVFSPSLVDARSQAGRLLVLFRGDGYDKSVGLAQEAASLPEWIRRRGFDIDRQAPLLATAGNVQAFLRLASDAAASAARARTLDAATLDLCSVYACLVGAWGLPIDGVVVPGIVALLRAFDGSPAS